MDKFYQLLALVLVIFCGNVCVAQSNAGIPKSSFYFAVGTNWSFYSPSTIRFQKTQPPGFNFTLYRVRGKDDGGLRFNHGAPQYSYQLGWYNHNKDFGVEFNFDHMKYYIRQNQRVHLQGIIENKPMDTDTLITPDFVKLEHSDGANYALLKLVKWIALAENKQANTLNLVLKGGAGPVIPKTNSTIMGKHRDDRYHISGYVVAVEGALRYNFTKHLFAEADAKGAYADYSHFLIADGRGSQRWLGLHIGLLVGVQLDK